MVLKTAIRPPWTSAFTGLLQSDGGTVTQVADGTEAQVLKIVGGNRVWADEGAGSGEANTASNLGAGIGVFEAKAGVDLQFNSLVGVAPIAISEDDLNNEIDVILSGTKSQFDDACSDGDFAFAGGAYHDGFSDFVANEHIDWTAANQNFLTTGTGAFGSDLTIYEAVNDGNPQLRLGAADAEELHVQTVYDTGSQTLDYVLFQTDVASATANKGLFRFNVDGTDILDIDDDGIDLATGKAFSINGTDVLTATTLGSSVVNSSLTSVGTIAIGVWNGTDIAVADGGTGLSTISALSIWLANSANVITELTPGAGNSLRINAGGTAWEAYTPATGGAPTNADYLVGTANASLSAEIVVGTTELSLVNLGSTLVGGSATTADLNLKTTSGIGATGADMHFLVGNNGATEAMTILNSGNVGIGTTNPASYKLDVQSTGTSVARFTNTAVNGNAQIELQSYGTQTILLFGVNYDSQAYIGTTNNYPLTFIANNAEKIRIQTDGNVGIGETAPDSMLEIATNATTKQALHIKGAVSQSANLTEWTDSADGVLTAIDADGNIGIGTATPGARLEVRGATDYLRFRNDVSAVGELLAGSWIENRGGNNLVLFGQADGTPGKGIVIPYYGDTWNSGIELLNVTSGFGNLLLMKSGGNVGIGTASPNQLLTVENSVSLKEIAAANADTAAYGQIWVKSDVPNILMFTDDAGTDFTLAHHATTTLSFLASIGTITTGVWNGTDIAVADGGTGRSTATAYAVLCGGTSSTDPHQSVDGLGTVGQFLTSNGAAALPTWQGASSTVNSYTVYTPDQGDPLSPAGYEDLRVAGGDGITSVGAAGSPDTLTLAVDTTVARVTGTPADNQIAVWATSTALEGTTSLTFDGSDLIQYEAVNDGNPQLRLGAADAEELHIQTVYDSVAQTLDYVLFQTDVASVTANKGLYRFNVDGTDILDIDDGGIDLATGKALSINGTDVLTATTLGSSVVNSSLTSVGTIATGVWNGTDIAVADGGTGLSTISALSIWLANSANTITELTPGAGNSLRINAGGTAWEAYTPATSGAPADVDYLVGTASGELSAEIVVGTTELSLVNLGSTLVGGSATTADLNLKTTSGVGTTGADMHFLVGNNGATEAMTILNSGNIGVGTASPNQLLTVENSVSLKEIANANVDTAAYGQIWVKSDTPNILMFTDDAGTDFILAHNATTTLSFLASIGTITTGVWNGTDIAVADGGTGRSTATAYAVLCGGTTTTAAHQSVASVGTAGQFLTSNGASALPTFQSASSTVNSYTVYTPDQGDPLSPAGYESLRVAGGDGITSIGAAGAPDTLTLNVDTTVARVTGTPADSQVAVWTNSTTLEGTTSLTFNGSDFAQYEAVNDGNPQLRLGATDAEELHIQTVYDSVAQTLNYVLFQTDTASVTANKGLYRFNVDGTDILDIDDGGIDLDVGKALSINGTDVLTATTLGSSVVNSSLTSVGTIATGVWNGTDIAVADGGTGRSTATAYAVLCGGTTTTAAHQSVADLGTLGQVLTSNGAGALPTFQDAGAADNLGNHIATQDLDMDGFNVADGGVVFLREQAAADPDVAGQGQVWIKTATPNQLWFTDDAGTDFQVATLAGTEILTNKTIDGNNNTLTVLAASQLSGAVPVANGGTGNSTATAYAVLCGGTSSTNPHQSVASVGTLGQFLTSNGAGALPTFQSASSTVNSYTVYTPDQGDPLSPAGYESLRVAGGDGITSVGAAGSPDTLTLAVDTTVARVTGTPADNQIAVWVNSTTLKVYSGNYEFSFNGHQLQLREKINDGSPEISIGSGGQESLSVKTVYDTGAQTLDYALFQTAAVSATANKGLFRFNVDGTDILDIDDGGIDLVTGKALSINGTDVLTATTLGSTVVNSSLTSVGTIATGVWNGTDIAVADGGTGNSTATAYAVLCGGTSSTNPHQSVASVGALGQVLTSNGAGALPTFQAAGAADNLGNHTATQDLDMDGFNVADGGVIFLREQAAADPDIAGQGQVWIKTVTPNRLWFTDDAGTDFQVATLAGTETLTNKTIDGNNNTLTVLAASQLSGTVPVANGGSGRASATAYAVLCGGTTTTAAHQSVASLGTLGQVLTSNGAAALPTFQDGAAGGDAFTTVVADSGTNPVAVGADTLNLVGGFGITTSGNAGTDTVSFAVLLPIRTETQDYTVLSSDHTLLGDAATLGMTFNLPLASEVPKKVYVIKKIDSTGNTVTADANSTDTIDGAGTVVLGTQYHVIMIQSDGSSTWHIIARWT